MRLTLGSLHCVKGLFSNWYTCTCVLLWLRDIHIRLGTRVWYHCSSACMYIYSRIRFSSPWQKACQVTCAVFSKHVKKEIVTIVDEEKVRTTAVYRSTANLACPPEFIMDWFSHRELNTQNWQMASSMQSQKRRNLFQLELNPIRYGIELDLVWNRIGSGME